MNRKNFKGLLSIVSNSPSKSKKKPPSVSDNLSDRDRDEEFNNIDGSVSMIHYEASENMMKMEVQELVDNRFKIQLQRNLDDLLAKDINERTLLHRAALDQNVKLMEDVIKDYENIQKNDKTIESEIKSTEVFINLRDKFGNTPLLNACSLAIEGESSRVSCLKLLLEKGADVQAKNKRTLWNAMHWIAFHGEEDCAKILLEKDIAVNTPDYLGFYPLDIAGKQNHSDKSVALLLLQRLFDGMNNYHKELLEDRTPEDRYWNCPMLKTSILYWAVKFQFGNSFDLQMMCDWLNIYVEGPMLHNHKMTVIHVAAQLENEGCLKDLIERSKKKKEDLKKNPHLENKIKSMKTFSFNPEDNEVFSIKKEELKIYDRKFVERISKFAKWIFNYEKDIIENPKSKVWYDEPDLYGNTPLHLAAMACRENAVKLLINSGCDLYKSNKEGFRVRELIQNLIQNSKFQGAFLNIGVSQDLANTPLSKTFQRRQEEETKMAIQNNIEKAMKKENNQRMKQKSRFRGNNKNAVTANNYTTFSTKSVDDLLQNLIKIPEFIIRFHKKPKKHRREERDFAYSNPKDDINAERINFYISLLINANFDVYLAPSIDDNFYYVMLSLNKKQLYKQCSNLKMRLKLIDSYSYAIYEQTKDEDNLTKFEPLRSTQRQEIIFKKVKNILDLHMLKSEGLVKDFFNTHTPSGITQIRQKWIEKPLWYWPQPLNQLDDYLLEGKLQNFSSITDLKQYLGEKISFYFAWRSFCTCFFLPLAIPGLALQIYIVVYEGYHSQILLLWVFFVSLYTTIMVEFWKRKCSEINTRWGNLDLMNDESWMSKEFRSEYSGDESVNSNSQQITKVNPTKVTIYVFLLSIPVLIVLLGACVGTYLLTKEYKDSYSSSEYATFHSVMAGLINGVVITALNYIYTQIARWFVNKENHKFQKDFENSLIGKSFSFQIVNSFFTIFVVAFLDSDSDFKSLFETLWPILIYKQASNICVQVVVPWLKYKYRQRKYFQKVDRKATEQKKSNVARAKNNEQRDSPDEIIAYAKRNGMDFNEYWERIVLHFHLGESQKDISAQCDMDQVELNSHRDDFLDTVDSYAEGFISFGYITMFTAAFPIGPMIALVVDTVQLRWKIFSFLFALRRPNAEKSTGIGMWLNIWEAMSVVSVFTNFLLLFFQPKIHFDIFYEIDQTSDQDLQRLWLVIILVAIIIFVKFIFRAVIPDKPRWVFEEEERQKALKSNSKSGDESKKGVSSKYEQELREQRDKLHKKELSMKLEKEGFRKKIKQLETERNNLKQKIKEKNLQNTISNTQTLPKTPQDYKAKAISLFYKTFKFIEHELLIQRINDINKFEGNALFLCNECHRSRSVLECLDCQEHFCRRCFKDIHVTTHIMVGKPAQPNISLLLPNKHQTEIFKDLTNVQDRAKFIKEKLQKENQKQTAPPKSKITVKKPLKNEEKTTNLTDWKKFEYFSLPIYEKSSFFSGLIKYFGALYRVYVEGNYIFGNKNILNLDLAVSEFQFEESKELPLLAITATTQSRSKMGGKGSTKGMEFKDINGNFLKIKSPHMLEILNSEDFNVEDKLFLNRIAFMGFRKYGHKFKFQDFLKYCKKLQDGNPMQKMVLFVRMVEFGEEIEKDNVMDFMFPSLLRNVAKEDLKCWEVISDLFRKETSFKSGSFIAEIDSKNNVEFKNMMEAFMQLN